MATPSHADERPHRPAPDPSRRSLAASWQDTDWQQIVILYDMLLCLAPSLVTRLHRAIALRYVAGAEKALAELESLDLDRYHLYHATAADDASGSRRGWRERVVSVEHRVPGRRR